MTFCCKTQKAAVASSSRWGVVGRLRFERAVPSPCAFFPVVLCVLSADAVAVD
jgi:hypothetical protein